METPMYDDEKKIIDEAKPVLPGGEYAADQNPNGTWNVRDVPVFCECSRTVEVNGESVTYEFGAEWLIGALHKAQARQAEGYLAPVQIDHERTGQMHMPELVGYMRLTSVRKILYDGVERRAIFADLLNISEYEYRQIRDGRRAYRSVEIYRPAMMEINALALSSTAVPFFRLPLMTIGTETLVTEQPMEAADGPVVAAQGFSDRGGVRLLFNFSAGDDTMQDTSTDALTTALAAVLEQLTSLAETITAAIAAKDAPPAEDDTGDADDDAGAGDDDSGDDAADDDSEEETPAPVNSSALADDVMQFRAQADVARAEASAARKELAVTNAVALAMPDMDVRGMGGEAKRAELFALGMSDGVAAITRYCEIVRELREPFPAQHFDAGNDHGQQTLPTNKAVAKFAALGPDAIEIATKAAAEFAELRKAKFQMRFGESAYIESVLREHGFDTPVGVAE